MLTLYADLKGIYGQDRYKIAYREILEAVNRGEEEGPGRGYSGNINGKRRNPSASAAGQRTAGSWNCWSYPTSTERS